MDNLELIEAYFNDELAQERKGEFDRRIISDPAFAEEVAFYLSTKEAAAAELEENRFRLAELYKQHKQGNIAGGRQAPLRKLWPWAAAAAMIAGILIIGYLFFGTSQSAQQLADGYLKKQLQKLSVTMNGSKDSLEIGKRLYNEGKFTEALRQFESIVSADTASFSAKKFAGIVCLRLEEYDKALYYFKQLEYYSLISNPAVFYQAITLLKRNLPGDESMAKVLLQQVVENDLEGNEDAEQWLKKW